MPAPTYPVQSLPPYVREALGAYSDAAFTLGQWSSDDRLSEEDQRDYDQRQDDLQASEDVLVAAIHRYRAEG